jgi:large subunit ribosomal protein L35
LLVPSVSEGPAWNQREANLVTSEALGEISMPKMKTHRGAAKRFKKSGSGKLQRNHAFHSHILTKKSPGRKSRLAGEVEVSPANAKTVKKMLPYL